MLRQLIFLITNTLNILRMSKQGTQKFDRNAQGLRHSCVFSEQVTCKYFDFA